MIAHEHPLRGIRLLIQEAKEGIHRLDAFVEGLDGSDYCSIVREPNLQTGYDDVVFKVVKALPVEISVIAGNVIRNLDAALDNLICAIYMEIRPNGNCSGLEFPIKHSADEFYAALGKRKMRQLGEPIIDKLRKRRPYPMGETRYELLRKLSREYKHRLPVDLQAQIMPHAGIEMRSQDFYFVLTEVRRGGRKIWPKVVKDGDIIVSIDADGEVEFDPKPAIVFYHPPLIDGKGVSTTLVELIALVEDTVDSFADEFQPE